MQSKRVLFSLVIMITFISRYYCYKELIVIHDDTVLSGVQLEIVFVHERIHYILGMCIAFVLLKC